MIKVSSSLFVLPLALACFYAFDRKTGFGTECFNNKKEISRLFDTTSVCDKAKEGIAIINALYHSNIFSSAKLALEKAARDRREHSITFGRDGHSIKASALNSGDTTSGKVNNDWPGAFADIHNHNNRLPPSAGDLYYLIKLNNNSVNYRTRFVLMSGGELFALYVYDLKLANDFIAHHPPERSAGFSPRFPEPVFDEFDKVSIYFEGQGENRLVAQERATAFALDKYKAGVVLLKQGVNGVFKFVQVKEQMDKGKKAFVVKECR